MNDDTLLIFVGFMPHTEYDFDYDEGRIVAVGTDASEVLAKCRATQGHRHATIEAWQDGVKIGVAERFVEVIRAGR